MIPPRLVSWLNVVSKINKGMPQDTRNRKYGIRNAPENVKENVQNQKCILESVFSKKDAVFTINLRVHKV